MQKQDKRSFQIREVLLILLLLEKMGESEYLLWPADQKKM